jgi:hypothetical protein
MDGTKELTERRCDGARVRILETKDVVLRITTVPDD